MTGPCRALPEGLQGLVTGPLLDFAGNYIDLLFRETLQLVQVIIIFELLSATGSMLRAKCFSAVA